MTSGRASEPTGRRRHLVACLASILALGAASFAWLRPTNFRGYDEWVIVSLLSRGILSFPHANRPLNLIWHLPAWLIAPDRLWGFLFVHAAWLTIAGILTFLLLRRLLPAERGFAFLAGAFAVVWMPNEPTRVSSVQMTLYSGCTVGVLLATWLLVEAWCRRRPWLLLPAGLAAGAACLSLEATLPQLAFAPILLLFCGGWLERQRFWRWTAGAAVFVAALAGRAALPLLTGSDGLSYQLRLASFNPAGSVPRRIGIQLQRHLWPLVTPAGSELLAPAVPVAVLVFAAGFVLVALLASRGQGSAPPRAEGPAGRRAVAVAGLVGLTHAVLGYWPMLMVRSARGIERTEFLATPGVAVLLGALVTLLASALRRHRGMATAGALGAWLVALGTGRTMAVQRGWDPAPYAEQRRTLLQFAALAPELEPRTLVVLLQGTGAWAFDFAFARAVDYLYEGNARGTVPTSDSHLYDTRYEPDGVVSERSSLLRAWKEETIRYRYDEVVVLFERKDGVLGIADSWPQDLGPLPPGKVYTPRARIHPHAPGPRRLAILDP